LFRNQALFARQAAVMRGDVFVTESFTEVTSDALGQSAGIHENQSGLMLSNHLRQPVVNFVPNFARHHSLQRRFRQLNRDIQPARVTTIDYDAVWIPLHIDVFSSHQEAGHFFDGTLGCG
jgi:hypothetical protein